MWLIHFACIVEHRLACSQSVDWFLFNTIQYYTWNEWNIYEIKCFICSRECWEVVYRQINRWFILNLQTRFDFKTRLRRSWDHQIDRYRRVQTFFCCCFVLYLFFRLRYYRLCIYMLFNGIFSHCSFEHWTTGLLFRLQFNIVLLCILNRLNLISWKLVPHNGFIANKLFITWTNGWLTRKAKKWTCINSR